MNLEATLSRDDLLAALKWAGQGIARRPVMMVLYGVRLTAGNAGVTVSGFDYEVTASDVVRAPGAVGEALVPYAEMLRMVASLPKGCDIRLDTVGQRLRMAAVDTRFMLPLLAIADYPVRPTITPTVTAALTGVQWQRLVKPCVTAGRDDSLPVLTGVQLSEQGGRLTAAATDRYRLGVQEVDVPWQGEVLVPARTLRAAARLLGSKVDEVRIAAQQGAPQDGTALFGLTSGTRTLLTRTLDGAFPKWSSLLPADDTFGRIVEFPRDDVLAAVERVRTAGARNAPMRFTVEGGDTLHVESGTDVDSDSFAAAEVHGLKVVKAPPTPDKAPVKGVMTTESLVALNDGYLRDGLLAFHGSETVVWNSPGETRPQVFRSPEQPGWTYLLMPVRLSG